jgi:hypothetical protein
MSCLSVDTRPYRMQSVTRVRPGQISFGDVQIEGGLTQGLIPREDDLLGGVAVLGFQTGAASRLGVHAVVLFSAFPAGDQTESNFHRHRSSL